MSFSLAEARFLFDRALGLSRRGWTSLRTRGWRATWERLQTQFQRVPAQQRAMLYFPAPAAFAPFPVPYNAVPRASIVIPAYNQFAHTLTCLRALSEHPPHATCEIIVVDDGSSDETAVALPQVSGLRYHRRPSNGGFIAACNDGAALARGEYLVFLNNDTVPQPGWLDALLRTFDEHPRTGLVGSQLLDPDGRLQEAGGIVRNDGQADNLGRFHSPFEPGFSYVREVDYCSGAAIAVRKEVFSALEGFNTRYAPAYYEDTDLGFSVRQRGFSVLYQPASRVVHAEGATSGTDTRKGVKNYQLRNQGVFASHWKQRLREQPSHQVPKDRATRHLYRRQVLIVDAMTPTPDHDSGSLRLLNLMRLLREEGAHVVFLPADLKHAGRYTESMQQLGVEAWHSPYSGSIPAWLRKHGDRFDVVMLSRHYVASSFMPLLRKYAPQAKIVFDTVDLHYLRETRGAELAGDAALLRDAEATRKRELDIIAQASTTLVVSELERQLLARDAPSANVELLSNLHHLSGAGLPFEERHDLVFVGGFRHPPNVDAVIWFVEEVFPRVRGAIPGMKFHCIGGHVPERIAALARHEGVTVHGHVPDITPYMDGVRIGLAPLRYGAGVKGKVNLSMAHGQPVVATSCAVEGMHLRNGHDVLVADSAEAYADAIVRLYGDRALWNELSRNGQDNVARHFSPDAARDVVRRVFFNDPQPTPSSPA
ncbi:GT2 family glycosyltransferase [Luteimonas cucumeris]|uniref:GT2 family glycosyltransferase n=1 Tax=Luteimonas cucumeris TaxID=985012 RepID=A0A562L509_9GAMM|nr:glycosyltransferase [Luteimonas cucumeris]TWI02750.1 GT2 family glycosyltransferase [Luteimonas cucumeris]